MWSLHVQLSKVKVLLFRLKLCIFLLGLPNNIKNIFRRCLIDCQISIMKYPKLTYFFLKGCTVSTNVQLSLTQSGSGQLYGPYSEICWNADLIDVVQLLRQDSLLLSMNKGHIRISNFFFNYLTPPTYTVLLVLYCKETNCCQLMHCQEGLFLYSRSLNRYCC